MPHLPLWFPFIALFLNLCVIKVTGEFADNNQNVYLSENDFSATEHTDSISSLVKKTCKRRSGKTNRICLGKKVHGPNNSTYSVRSFLSPVNIFLSFWRDYQPYDKTTSYCKYSSLEWFGWVFSRTTFSKTAPSLSCFSGFIPFFISPSHLIWLKVSVVYEPSWFTPDC